MTELHDKRFPGESAEYRRARGELLKAELELRDRVERVAELRRRLPLGGSLKEDYVFQELDESGRIRDVRFSELFASGKDTLILYNFMYGPDWEKPCPMCTALVDGYQGDAHYVQEHANMAVVARAEIEKLAAWGQERGWTRLRLLSARNNSYCADYHAEFTSPHGDQQPVLQVFTRRDGPIHHFWSSEILFCPEDEGANARHVDMTWSLWNLLDLTPEGRGNWVPSFQL